MRTPELRTAAADLEEAILTPRDARDVLLDLARAFEANAASPGERPGMAAEFERRQWQALAAGCKEVCAWQR